MKKQGKKPIVETTYVNWSPREHVYNRPNVYVGSDEKVLREEVLIEFLHLTKQGRRQPDLERSKEEGIADVKAVTTEVDLPPAVQRIFLEILSNAYDNVGRSRRVGVDPGSILIDMDETTVKIKNYGLSIPIKIHEPSGLYNPELIFGTMFTSSNYGVDLQDAGVNGVGAKATNIFSLEFTVICYDPANKVRYEQTWRKNMEQVDPPTIDFYDGSESSTEIRYQTDFPRFHLEKYPDTAFGLFARHAADTSFTARVPVQFNDHRFEYTEIKDYASLFFKPEEIATSLVYYRPFDLEIDGTKEEIREFKTRSKQEKKAFYAKNSTKKQELIPVVQLLALDTPDDGRQISFVNCMTTPDGGIHVDTAYKAVAGPIVESVNESVIRSLIKEGKVNKKEQRAFTVDIRDVKAHMSLLLSVTLVNPKLVPQTKTKLESPTPVIQIPDSLQQVTKGWWLRDRLLRALDSKHASVLAKSDGKNFKTRPDLKKGTDANFANSRDVAKRHQCVLYITEGQSAMKYAETMLTLVKGGRDYVGTLEMKGKSMNVMNLHLTSKIDLSKIEKNREICEIKAMLGLREGVDYTDEANFATLRYGSIMIMADSDVDGKHIIGLILNYFFCRFPSLLRLGYVFYWRTPIIRVKKGDISKKFYTPDAYDAWAEQTEDVKTWVHQYYKGLGTSTSEDVNEDYRAWKVVQCFYDDLTPDAMHLAFDETLADRRKVWISQWTRSLNVEDLDLQPISEFINKEFILFSRADLERSIPGLMDGFKESHRKIMHGAHIKWTITKGKTDYPKVKISTLNAFVMEKTGYQHGDNILPKVIAAMAQVYTGGYNINWFEPEGRLGSRFNGGKAAAPRYIYTRPGKLLPYILRKEDEALLDYVVDEGETLEPKTYYPIIPMILINGSQGIGTGHSTRIPCHNPLDVIAWLKGKLSGIPNRDLPEIRPWFRGYRGNIYVEKRTRNRRTVRLVTDQGTQAVSARLADQLQADTGSEEATDLGIRLSEEAPLDLTEDATVRETEDPYQRNPDRKLMSIVTEGEFYLKPDRTVVVTELPINIIPKKYGKWIDFLLSKGIITDRHCNSMEEQVYFELKGFKNPSMKTLQLRRRIGMTNMVVLDLIPDPKDPSREILKPVCFDTPEEIAQAFFERRLPIYEERKRLLLQRIADKVKILDQKRTVIDAYLRGELEIGGVTDVYLQEKMASLNIPISIYDSLTVRNYSLAGIEKLDTKIRGLRADFTQISQIEAEQMWLADLEELETVYRKVYPDAENTEGKTRKKKK